MEIYIHKFSFYQKDISDRNSNIAELYFEVSVINTTVFVDKSHTIRIWFEGINSNDESLEIVLIEHLYLPPNSTSIARLKGPLYNPQYSNETLKPYNCKIELLDANDNVIQTFSTLKYIFTSQSE